MLVDNPSSSSNEKKKVLEDGFNKYGFLNLRYKTSSQK